MEASDPRESEDQRLDDGRSEPASHHPAPPVDELMRQLVDPASEMLALQDRLRLLLDANRSIVGALSLSTVLRRIVVAARELVGARYAALGVIGVDGLPSSSSVGWMTLPWLSVTAEGPGRAWCAH
jgi:hypothetical protein